MNRTWLHFRGGTTIADKPTAEVNPASVDAGSPFTVVRLGPVEITIHDPGHADRIAAAFTDAAVKQQQALTEAGRP